MRWLLILVLLTPVWATNYFIAPASASPAGSDANAGTSAGAPWLTPNHALNCGDVISAAAGTYVETNFRTGVWGTVTCAAGNNVAWLKCATFDTCFISITGANNGMAPTRSYWGVQGWEITSTAGSGSQCFNFYVPDSVTSVHHVIMANNIANGCGNGGFTVGAFSATVGVDYVAEIGNIAYNAAQGSTNCYSGIDMVYPVNTDTATGTHIYIAGNFAFGNIDPNPCASGLPSDGHGILLDSLDGSTYTGQVVVENNISVFNGASGFQMFSSATAPVYVRYNTFYGNHTQTVMNANPCSEITVNTANLGQIYGNLVQAPTNTCNGAVAEYALGSTTDATSDIFYNNFIYNSAGHNTSVSSARLVSNTSGTDPAFANPVQPSAPSCGAFASVPLCMATVIANFTPTAAAAKAYGYQAVQTSGGQSFDTFFPQWLCGVTNLPSGLITMHCVTAGNYQH